MTSAVLQWSGGKDSALALSRLRRESRLAVDALLTMFNEGHDRTSWHGIRPAPMRAQAEALDLPLTFVPTAADPDTYVERVTDAFATCRAQGIEYLAVGDVEAEDPDTPRERAMTTAGLRPFYPLLGEPTADLVREFIDLGFCAKLVVVNGDVLDASFVGRELTRTLLDDLPEDVDDGGERGEYHTFVYNGPLFDDPIDVEMREVVTRSVAGTSYHYGDLRLA